MSRRRFKPPRPTSRPPLVLVIGVLPGFFLASGGLGIVGWFFPGCSGMALPLFRWRSWKSVFLDRALNNVFRRSLTKYQLSFSFALWEQLTSNRSLFSTQRRLTPANTNLRLCLLPFREVCHPIRKDRLLPMSRSLRVSDGKNRFWNEARVGSALRSR